MTRSAFVVVFLLGIISCSKSQDKEHIKPRLVGGPCEGCEAVFEYGDRQLSPTDTLPDYFDKGMRIKVTGTVYETDGKTPASGVIIYIYHTDQEGIYATKGDEVGWAKRHGYIRGWIKTSAEGRYTFYTLKPGTYPNRAEAAHIHPIILEPDGKYYWLRGFHFTGDPLLTEEDTSPKSPRGGSVGLLDLKKEGDIWVGVQDIILGKNIKDYN